MAKNQGIRAVDQINRLITYLSESNAYLTVKDRDFIIEKTGISRVTLSKCMNGKCNNYETLSVIAELVKQIIAKRNEFVDSIEKVA